MVGYHIDIFMKERMKQLEADQEAQRQVSPVLDDNLKQIENCHARFEAGDGMALLEAVLITLGTKIIPPDWLAVGFRSAFTSYWNADVKTLDDAFNVHRPKGFSTKAEAKRRQWVGFAVIDIVLLSSLGAAIDDNLFDAVGNNYGISGGTVKERYYYHKNNKTEIYESALNRGNYRPFQLSVYDIAETLGIDVGKGLDDLINVFFPAGMPPVYQNGTPRVLDQKNSRNSKKT